jgi:hypothetical protein
MYILIMAGKQVKPKIKPIDPNAQLYHYYQYTVSEFALFDDADDGTPVVVGSRNLVDATIRRLSKSVTIFYYKKNIDGYWEKKMQYVGQSLDQSQINVQPQPGET